MLTIVSLRAAIGAEFKAATTEVETELHRFVDFLEGKAQRIADAEALLKAEGFTVIDPTPTAPAAPSPAAAESVLSASPVEPPIALAA